MSTDLTVRRPELVRLDTEQIQYLANTEFVPERIRGNLPAIFATIATGREIGIGDMASLRHINFIDSKPTFSAEIMVVVARRDGHSIQGTVADGVATVTGKRADNGDTMTVEWTMAMAERAGLALKQNWRKYPEAMLWARAVSQLCRELFADCFAGATYTPEELEGSAGEPSADALPPVEDADTSSGSVAQAGEDEPASPAEQIHAAAKTARGDQPPVNMSDPDIPFGDAPPVRYISKSQRTRLFTIAGKCGLEEDDIRAIVREFTGQESTQQIPAGNVYDGIITAIEARGSA